MFGMLGVFAEFERAMIQERVKVGIPRAKAKGKRSGRSKLAPEVEQSIRPASENRDQHPGRQHSAISEGKIGLGFTVQQLPIEDAGDFEHRSPFRRQHKLVEFEIETRCQTPAVGAAGVEESE